MPMQKKNNRRERRDRDSDSELLGARKRQCPLAAGDLVDINDIELLKHFVTEYGKIIPARITGVTAEQQRQIKRGVRRARNMGLLA